MESTKDRLFLSRRSTKVEKTTICELSWEKAKQLQLIHGKNIVRFQKTWWQILLMFAVHPLSVLALTLAIAFLTTHIVATAMIVVIIHIMTLRFVPDPKSQVAHQIIKRVIGNQVTVIRKISTPCDPWCVSTTEEYEIPIEDVVPGDIVILSTGDTIPGDIQLLESKDLCIYQVTLPEEAVPEEKKIIVDDIRNLDRPYLCFMGAKVICGSAKSVVLRIGNNTLLGNFIKQLENNEHVGNIWKGVCIAIPIAFLLLFQFLDGKELLITMGLPLNILQMITNSNFIQNVLLIAIFVRLQLHCIVVAAGRHPKTLEVIANAHVAKSMLVMTTTIYIFIPYLGLHYIYLIGVTLGYYLMIRFGQKIIVRAYRR